VKEIPHVRKHSFANEAVDLEARRSESVPGAGLGRESDDSIAAVAVAAAAVAGGGGGEKQSKHFNIHTHHHWVHHFGTTTYTIVIIMHSRKHNPYKKMEKSGLETATDRLIIYMYTALGKRCSRCE
jgi:hypothetical protein